MTAATARHHPRWRGRATATLAWVRGPLASVRACDGTGCAYVDRVEVRGSTGCVYPEITGYALSALEGLIVAPDVPQAEVASLADQTAAFLHQLVVRHGGGVPGPARHPAAAGRRYTFDTGMVLKGLTAHAVRAGTRPHESLGLAVAFLRSAIDDRGTVDPFGPGEPPTAPRWSTRPGPFLLKAVLGLLCGCHALAAVAEHRGAIERALDRALAMQDADGVFNGDAAWSGHMHAHLYACEAAFLIGAHLDIAEARRAAALGSLAALRCFRTLNRLPPVGVARHADAERSDTVAQLLRLCLLTGTGRASDRAALAERLEGYQDPSLGALSFGVDYDVDANECRAATTHLSTHATLFALQAWTALTSDDVVAQWTRAPWTFA